MSNYSNAPAEGKETLQDRQTTLAEKSYGVASEQKPVDLARERDEEDFIGSQRDDGALYVKGHPVIRDGEQRHI